MIKRITYIFIFLFFAACQLNAQCTAYFAFSADTSGTVVFTDSSVVDSIDLITSWSWSFPGGVPSTSSSQNPVVTWTAQGVYIVCLTIVTMNSCMDTFCDSILIEPCTGFDINYTVINESYPGASDGMILTNVTGGNPPYSYLWSNSAVTQNISGLTSGQYCVTVTDTDSCLLIECMYVNLDSAVFCNADFNIQPAYCQNCFGFPDTSTASGTINSWYWDFGDGSWSNLQNPEHTYQDSGFYQVCLTITTDDSCTSTFCDSVYAQYNLVTYSISGLVYANSAMLPSGTAELYDSSLPQGNPPFYTETITNGIYYFPSVAAGNYKLLAVPGLPESDDYADTWFGDATAFSSAYTLPVYANLISVDIHLVYTSGISQNESQGSFLVYPNPVEDMIYVKIPDHISGKVQFRIITVDGKYVHSYTCNDVFVDNEISLDVSGLEKGVYLLQFLLPDGNIVTKSFVK